MRRPLRFLTFLSLALVTHALSAPRVGQHDGFTRLVLDLPTVPTFSSEHTLTGVRVTLDTPLSAGQLALTTREVRGSRLTPQGDRTQWDIDTAAAWPGASSVKVLPAANGHGARLVVDVGPALLPPPGANGPCLPPAAVSSLPTPPPPAALSGQLGLYVALLDPLTAQPVRVVSQLPNTQFPLASAYKTPLLWAVLRGVDAGQLHLNEQFGIDEANRSLGHPYRGRSDAAILARRMIEVSDNTATDLLHRRVGLDAPQRLADSLGLCRTRLLLPTKTWWVAQAGLSPDFPNDALFEAAHRYAQAARPEQLQLALKLDAVARSVSADSLEDALDRYFKSKRYRLEIDRDTQNASTPHEFATLLAQQFLRGGLSPASEAVMRDTMSLGHGRKRLNFPVTYFAGKGGSGWRILTMSGYLELPGGEKVVYVFMNHGSRRTVDTLADIPPAFEWINAAVRTVLEPPAQK